MPAKLSTTLSKLEQLTNEQDANLITQFYEFMKENGTSERHQNNNLKAIIAFSLFLANKGLDKVNSKDDVLAFLQKKVKSKDEDPEEKWITTYNDYLHRIKHFLRWLYNRNTHCDNLQMDLWENPSFLASIKTKKTKRLSPYSESEIWDKDEFLSLIKYEPHIRNKAALALMWDLDARNHEITSLKIKNIRLKEKYGEGEIPFNTKTGGGPILLTLSFPYLRDWLNLHPFRNEPEARLICNLHTGGPITPDALHTVMSQLRRRIVRLLETQEMTDVQERDRLTLLLNSKRFNPYCIRHSSISYDSDYLPEYALKKKVRWSINSKQGARYIKRRMGNELKNKILEYNGIISKDEKSIKSSVSTCPRCDLTNIIENKYCSQCSYPLNPNAFDEIKQSEELRMKRLEEKYEQQIKTLREDMESKFSQLIKLVNIQLTE